MIKQTTKALLQSCRYQHRAVNDLAWALLSPSLFGALPPNCNDQWLKEDYIDGDVLSWLKLLDAQPQDLLLHLQARRSTRLGIYFEQLLSFYFSYHPRFELLAKNLQVTANKKTIGEFDFIVLDKLERRYRHIEVAVKFYLGHTNYRGVITNNIPMYNWHKWIGPNQRDSLAIKMRHLIQHQLPLSKTSDGLARLEALGIKGAGVIESRLLIKGRFYLPAIGDKLLPDYCSANCQISLWYETQTLFSEPYLLDSESLYCLLPRQYWLSEISPGDHFLSSQTPYTLDGVIEKLKQDAITVGDWQWVEISIHKKDQAYREKRRFFVINSQHLPSDELRQTHSQEQN